MSSAWARPGPGVSAGVPCKPIACLVGVALCAQAVAEPKKRRRAFGPLLGSGCADLRLGGNRRNVLWFHMRMLGLIGRRQMPGFVCILAGLLAAPQADSTASAETSRAEGLQREDAVAEGAEEVTPKKKTGFPAHWRAGQLAAGLKSGRLLTGQLRCPKSQTRGLVLVHDLGEFVVKGSQNMNRAVDGDIVVIERLTAAQDATAATAVLRHGMITEEDEVQKVMQEGSEALLFGDKPGARIVAIKERSQREIAGTIYAIDQLEDAERVAADSEARKDDVVLVPADERFPRMFLGPEEVKEDVKDKRVAVVISAWPQSSDFPRARWSRELGKIGDLSTETQVILLEHSVKDEPFTEEVLKCLPPANFTVPKEEVEKRLDLRGLCIFSIDPPGCEDVDDALSCVKLDNGNFEVGVHIADVTHYVKPGTELDREAAERSTSVYLVDRRVDMLPRLLTTDICSLRCDGKDRLTFSAIFEMTPEAVVVNTTFAKGVVNSRAALSYKEAQERLDAKSEDEIGQAIQNLAALARKLRAQRFEDGALDLESGELKFELDASSQSPTNVFKYESFFANKLIEEFMLLANRKTAEQISKNFPKLSVLRRHPPPKPEYMQQLVELLEASNIKGFNCETNKNLQQSLEKVENPRDPFFNRLVRILATRCMDEAVYFCTGTLPESHWDHYGLAMHKYTHFTSPIRRYADVLVHRQLSASLGLEEMPRLLRHMQELEDACEHLNYKNRMARYADRASVSFHLYSFFLKSGPVVAEGVVMRVLKEGISVAVEEYGAEGVAELEKMSWGTVLDAQMAYGRPQSKFQGMEINIFSRVIVSIEADTEDQSHRLLKMTFKGMPSQLPDGSQAPMPEVSAELQSAG
ncbi:unnamed protein product [Effrenium voratum]|nr:unnamed protein product [Effrenium voratum]